MFEWAPVTNDSREEHLKLRSKRIAESESQAEYEHGEQPLAGSPVPSDSSDKGIICFGPPTLEEFINEMREKAEQLKRELAAAKKKEFILKFALDRFSGSSEDKLLHKIS